MERQQFSLISAIISVVHAILLLGGKSRRFWPLQEKSLFPICGTNLATRQIKMLEACKCDVTLVCSEENAKGMKTAFPTLKIILQKAGPGMQGALISALPSLKGNPVLIVSGNDLFDEGVLRELIHTPKKGEGAILAERVKRYFPGGYLTVKNRRITDIIEKPGEGKEPSDLVNIVAHIHPDASMLLKKLKNTRSKRDDAYEVALAELFRETTYRAVRNHSVWHAVKYPWHLLSVLPLFLADITKSHISKKASIHKSAVIDGPVTIEDGVRILPHATIRGPAFVGKNSLIGNNALVRNASIGPDCIIGFGTEVKGSILAGRVWTHMTYIGDSVIGSNVAFGGGCITGNFRLDEGEVFSTVDTERTATGLTKFGAIIGPNSHLGIQVGTNPGIKIGESSFIAGGTFVTGDIPDRSFVATKSGEVVVRPNTAISKIAGTRDMYRKKL